MPDELQQTTEEVSKVPAHQGDVRTGQRL